MSAVKANWSQLPTQGVVIDACQNISGNRLATSSLDGQSAYIQIWEPDDGEGDWSLLSQVQAPASINHLAWAHPESGYLVAGCSDNGHLYVWEAPHPLSATVTDSAESASEVEEEPDWRLTSQLRCSTAPIRQICFAPRQLGLILTAACEDGYIYIYEADRPLAPSAWLLQSKFKAGSSKPSDNTTRPTICLSWRPFSPGIAPLLAVSSAAAANIWQYSNTFMTWQQVASLQTSTSTQPSSIHWAPSLGRSLDLVAVATGSKVDIFSLKGDSSEPQTELLSSLVHAADVWKVEWNMLGNCLAAATDTNHIYLWKADFVGAWQLLSVIHGTPDIAE